MKSIGRWQRTLDLASSAVVGGMIGLILSALGGVVSGSTAGTVATIGLAAFVGARGDGAAGILCGIWCGVLIVNFAATIGASPNGFAATAFVGAVLGAWFDWLVGAPQRGQGGGRFRRYAPPASGVIRRSMGGLVGLRRRLNLYPASARNF